MKATRRILSFLLAITLVLGLTVTALGDNTVQTEEYTGTGATTDGEIHVNNAVAGREYVLLKLFDVTIVNGVTKYARMSGKTDMKTASEVTWIEEIDNPYYDPTKDASDTNAIKLESRMSGVIDGADWFEEDATEGTIKVKGTWDETPASIDALMKSPKFQAWAKDYGVEVISAVAQAPGSSAANATAEIRFTKIPYGYYVVNVKPVGGTNPEDPWNPATQTGFKGIAAINTANPTAEVADKNNNPHFTDQYGKTILDKKVDGDKEAPNGSYGVDEPIPYSVKITTRNTDETDNGALIYKYYVYDTISEYLSYDGVPSLNIGGKDITSLDMVEYTYFRVPYEIIQMWLTAKASAGNEATVTWADLKNPADTTTFEYKGKTYGAWKQTTGEYDIAQNRKDWIIQDPVADRDEARSFRADITWHTPMVKFVDEGTFEPEGNTGRYFEKKWDAAANAGVGALVTEAEYTAAITADPGYNGGKTWANLPSVKDGKYDPTTDPNLTQYIGKDYGVVTSATPNAMYTQHYNDGDILILSYKAKLDSNKLGNKDPGDISSENKAGFGKYNTNNDPDSVQPSDPKGIAPIQTAENYTVELIIYKKDEDGTKPLKGATFTLKGTGTVKTLVTGEDFVKYDATATPAPNPAEFTYWKLTDGTYTLTDPAGYDASTPEGQAALALYDNTAETYKRISVRNYIDAAANASGTAVPTVLVDDSNVYNFGSEDDKGEQRVSWAGLGSGYYTLVESTAPSGYNAIGDKTICIKFNDPLDPSFVPATAATPNNPATPIFEAYEVVNTAAQGEDPVYEPVPNGLKFEYHEGKAAVVDPVTLQITTAGEPCRLTAEVVNKKGGELPSTGGIGTTIFYVVGSVLLVGAAVVLYSRRRMNIEDSGN